MRFVILATDYDGTLAHDGIVAPATVEAIQKLRQSGRKPVLVTGRELPDLENIFPHLDLFDMIVAENGALLYNPTTREKRTLAQAPPPEFVESLRRKGVSNMSVGEVIVALWRPDEERVIRVIREAGLELQVIFNKDSVMILPSGVNKATGLNAALKQMGMSAHNVLGIGDAENDHAFLSCCECAVAVSNAIPALKDRADFVTAGSQGDGVVEIIEALLKDDLATLPLRQDRHRLVLGQSGDKEITLPGAPNHVLICGQSGGGKSTLVTAIVERMVERKYQICIIDPEGDYENTGAFTTTGAPDHGPSLDHLAALLDDPQSQIAVNLTGVTREERAKVFGSVVHMIQERRVQTGRPHWLIVDEAHHMLPAEWGPAKDELPEHLANVIMVTVHPQHVCAAALEKLDTVIVVGRDPKAILKEFADAVKTDLPPLPDRDPETGEAIVWFRESGETVLFRAITSNTERQRHRKKYAEGELDEDRAFTFRGPQGAMNLRVRNLMNFIQIAEGIDDETWLYHLRRGDYSRWFRDSIGDDELADQIAEAEHGAPGESRKRIIEAIEAKYTAPA